MNLTSKQLAFGFLAISMVSCVATPDREKKGLLAGAQRVLALDFGRRVTGHVTGPRVKRLTRLPTAVATEFRRTQDVLGLRGNRPLSATATNELRRTERIHKLGSQFLSSEVMRRPTLFEGALPTSFEFSKNTANSIDNLGQLLGPGPRPLNEIDDYTHRTDHTDRRPQSTLWQRLRRRLPF